VTESAFAVLALLVLGWAVISDLLARANVNGPLVFLVAGYVLGNPDWGPLSVDVDTPSVHLLAEITLALLLFSDAARVNVSKLRRDISLPARLLGIGLPLSVLLGSLAAAWILHDFTWALAGFVGATLAPTDAALSAQVINDRRVPMRLRRLLNVESGLNDGIVTPIVGFTLAVAAGQLGIAAHSSGGGALLELTVGVLVGLSIGLGSAALISLGSRRHWIVSGGRRLAALAAALSSFGLAVALDGNGFIAAFVAGIAFGAQLDPTVADVERTGELPELVGEVLALAVWFLFGAVLVPFAFTWFDPSILVYAVLSLTVVRCLPVAVSLIGSGFDWPTVLFLGWFGPRGLASVVFALLAVEELGVGGDVAPAVAAVAFTVLMSVVLHGVSASPLASLYARTERDHDETGDAPRSRRSAESGVRPTPDAAPDESPRTR
jgi:NhaP-type Na+/H+ or K+/H+ antiporter